MSPKMRASRASNSVGERFEEGNEAKIGKNTERHGNSTSYRREPSKASNQFNWNGWTVIEAGWRVGNYQGDFITVYE